MGQLPPRKIAPGDEAEGAIATPVDYKRGAAPDIPEGAWEADRVQLCAQGLLLRDHGYTCTEGVVYYSKSRTRVRIPFDETLLSRTLTARDDFFAAVAMERLVVFEGKTRLADAKLMCTSEVCLYGGAQITTQALHACFDPVQYSVFVCELSRTERAELKDKLAAVLNHAEDQVMFVHLGPATGHGAWCFETLGRALSPGARKVVVV